MILAFGSLVVWHVCDNNLFHFTSKLDRRQSHPRHILINFVISILTTDNWFTNNLRLQIFTFYINYCLPIFRRWSCVKISFFNPIHNCVLKGNLGNYLFIFFIFLLLNYTWSLCYHLIDIFLYCCSFFDNTRLYELIFRIVYKCRTLIAFRTNIAKLRRDVSHLCLSVNVYITIFIIFYLDRNGKRMFFSLHLVHILSWSGTCMIVD